MPNVGIAEIAVIFATILMIVLIAYAVIVLVVRTMHRVLPSTTPRDPAVDALRTRFANGDIDLAEFERLRSVLQRH